MLLIAVDVRQNGNCIKNVNHLKYYKQSIEKYNEYLRRKHNRRGKSIIEMRKPCQVEKDERFWLVVCMMTIFYSQNRTKELTRLFRNSYGIFPTVKGVASWEECLKGDLHLFFVVNLPSWVPYKNLFLKHLTKRQFIPKDLPYRENCDWQNISSRLGWLAWGDFKDVNKDCCRWLK